MREGRETLRLKFESETNIAMNDKTMAWKKYALWLEHLAVNGLRSKIIKENNHLRARIQRVLNILDDALTARISD